MTGFLSAQSPLCFIARSSRSHTWCYKQLLPASLTCKNAPFPSGPWSGHQPERCTTYSTRRAARSGSVRIHGGSEGTESGRGLQAFSPGPPTLCGLNERRRRNAHRGSPTVRDLLQLQLRNNETAEAWEKAPKTKRNGGKEEGKPLNLNSTFFKPSLAKRDSRCRNKHQEEIKHPLLKLVK